MFITIYYMEIIFITTYGNHVHYYIWESCRDNEKLSIIAALEMRFRIQALYSNTSC